MSRASKSVNAAYIRSALEVKAQRDELLVVLRRLVGSLRLDPNCCVEVDALKDARTAIRKAKKWT